MREQLVIKFNKSRHRYCVRVHSCIVLIKEHFVLGRMLSFHLQIVLEGIQLVGIVFTIVSISLLNVNDENYTACTLKNCRHDINDWRTNLRLLRRGSARKNPRKWRKNSSWLQLINAKHCFEPVARLRLRSVVSKSAPSLRITFWYLSDHSKSKSKPLCHVICQRLSRSRAFPISVWQQTPYRGFCQLYTM